MQYTDHLRLVAVFHFVGGFFAVCVTLFFSVSILSISGQLVEASNSSDPSLFIVILTLVCGAAIVVSPILSGACIATRNFRLFSILVSLLFLPFFPIGTAIGIYSLWVLTSTETRMLYR